MQRYFHILKSIYTVVPDIQHLIGKKDGWFDQELAQQLGADIAGRLAAQLGKAPQTPTLRLSQMGPKCSSALWHSIHSAGENEPLPPWAELKFAFGHIIEALAVTLIKAAGHEVTGEQDAVYVDGVKGHRDCIVDGCIVDIKSASSLSFKKFKDGSLKDNDPFGYLEQLDAYAVGSLDDPLVRIRDRAFIIAIDKTLGHMCLYQHDIRTDHIRKRVSEYKTVVEQTSSPRCNCTTVPEGKSGNIKLGMEASYSAQKYSCFPYLRKFIYSNGPVWLTKVVRKPDVPEQDRYGNPVYS